MKHFARMQLLKMLMFTMVVCGFAITLAGCAPATVIQSPTPPHYALVDNLGVDSILPPPQRNLYDPKLYRDPDVPFAKDLKGYNDYISREVAKLQMRIGESDPSTLVEKNCRPFVLPDRNPEPKFRPSSLNSKDALLEESLTYAKVIREHYATWAKQVDDEFTAYRQRCKL